MKTLFYLVSVVCGHIILTILSKIIGFEATVLAGISILLGTIYFKDEE